jgi:hypothetical protein
VVRVSFLRPCVAVAESALKPRDSLKARLGSERRGCPRGHGADAEPQQEVVGRPGAYTLPHAAAAAAPRDEVGGRGIPKLRAPQRRGRGRRQRWRREGSRSERPGRAPVQVSWSRSRIQVGRMLGTDDLRNRAWQ